MYDEALRNLIVYSVMAAACMGILGAGCYAGHVNGRNQEQKKAIEAGVGRFVVDSGTGDTRFEYGVKR